MGGVGEWSVVPIVHYPRAPVGQSSSSSSSSQVFFSSPHSVVVPASPRCVRCTDDKTHVAGKRLFVFCFGGVVCIFSKFGAGCIFFQYLVTNYIFSGSSKGWLYFLVIFFEFLVFCHAFRANSVVFFSRARQSDQFFSKPPCAGDTHDLRRLRWR